MKKNIHPTWYNDAKVTCICGNTFTTGSIVPEIRVEICAKCHPFFTGQQKLVDTQGQVEKFSRTKQASEVKKAERAKIAEIRASKVQATRTEKPSLKELLMQARKKATS